MYTTMNTNVHEREHDPVPSGPLESPSCIRAFVRLLVDVAAKSLLLFALGLFCDTADTLIFKVGSFSSPF